MKVTRVEFAQKAEWLRMRLALWPEFSADDHSSDLDDYFYNPDKAALVAVRPDGHLGGFLEASMRPFAEGCQPGRIGYIEGWFVDADLRRSGVGAQLVEAAENWARAQGCTEMASDCDLDNDVSFRSHQALGYEEACRLIHFRKNLYNTE